MLTNEDLQRLAQNKPLQSSLMLEDVHVVMQAMAVEILESRERERWRSWHEKPPAHGYYLVTCNEHWDMEVEVYQYWKQDGEEGWEHGMWEGYTHWRSLDLPLPETPKGVE